jgi:GDP-L-fucose synthase
MLNKSTIIYVAGHTGLVGSAIVNKLKANGFDNIISRTHRELDLTSQQAVADFYAAEQPDHVVLAAAKVGGIHANNEFPAEFIYQNLMIETNVIHQAWRSGINRLLFLGSSCIYPKHASQPMMESGLLTSRLEPTNEPYAIAKIAGIKLCESYNRQYGTQYRSAMPTNLYGPNDNFHAKNSHVIPALIRRIHEAKLNGDEDVLIWGTGNASREFLYVDDMAAACLYIMELSDEAYAQQTQPMLSHINAGTGKDLTIRQLAETICWIVGYQGALKFDSSKPDGTARKLLDVSRLGKLGWKASTTLEEGLQKTYQWFLQHQDDFRY